MKGNLKHWTIIMFEIYFNIVTSEVLFLHPSHLIIHLLFFFFAVSVKLYKELGLMSPRLIRHKAVSNSEEEKGEEQILTEAFGNTKDFDR